MDVFFYIKKQDKQRVLECGLRLSEWADRKIFIFGIQQIALRTLLNPKDDIKKFNDENYVPIRIRIDHQTAIIAEGIFYNDFLYNRGMNKLYNESIVYFGKYVFGSYRQPECLLTGTVSNIYLKEMDKLIDVPVLYDSSEELYLNDQIEYGKEMYSSFYDKLLYRYYSNLHDKGYYKLYTTSDNDYAIFKSEVGKHTISVKKF